MPLPENQQAAGPRSSRGPVVWRWGGSTLLLLCAWMLARHAGGGASAEETATTAKDLPRASAERKLAREPFVAKPGHEPGRGIISPNDPELAKMLTSLQSEADPGKRQMILEAFLDRCPIEDIRRILNDLQGLSPDARAREVSVALLRCWAAADGIAAAHWAERLPAGPLRDDALAGVAIVWANTGLADAASWAGHLRNGSEHDAALLAVAGEAVRSDPVAALHLTADLSPDNPQREELVRHAAMEWAAQDGPAAVEWARQLPDGPARERLLAVIATAWSSGDPVSAATLATVEIPAGREQSDAIMGIIQRWAQSQPGQAAEWVDQFPDGELKQTAFENLAILGGVESSK